MTTKHRIPVAGFGGGASAEAKPASEADEAFVGALDTYRLPSTSLAGQSIELSFDGGIRLALDFRDEATVTWRSTGLDQAEPVDDPYDAVAVREDVTFATIEIASRRQDAATVVWSRTTGRALLVHSWIGPEGQVPRLSQSYHAGVIDGAALSGEPAGPTRDLIGMRNIYRYGPEVLYEHVYLNSERYVWQCLAGGSVGVGDVDLATVWAFGDGLYLFAFREYGIDVATVWLHDLAYEFKTTGAFLARGPEGEALHGRGGGDIYPLGRVAYPDIQPV